MIKETEHYKLDEKDTAILRALQNNARLTNKELAAKIHLSTTPTFERVRRLERLGFIKQYATIIDAGKVKLLFGSVQFAEEVEDLVQRIVRIAAVAVDFIDDDNRL